METKTLNLNYFGTNYPVSFRINHYANNENLYVGLMDHSEEFPEPWCDLTVNLDVKLEPDCAFIDINNNPYAMEWLIENEIGSFTGKWRQSGFCRYPEFRFKEEKLKEYGSEF